MKSLLGAALLLAGLAYPFWVHAMMERVCNRLDREYGGNYLYDDASARGEYLAQSGPNIRLTRGR